MIRKRIEYKIEDNSRTPNRGLGIKLPFNTQNVFTVNYTSKDQIKSNLTNFMLTNKGERPFNPEFGADLRNLLFEPSSDFTQARDILADELGRYFPTITINELNFSADPERHLLNINLNYTVNNTEDSILIQII